MADNEPKTETPLWERGLKFADEVGPGVGIHIEKLWKQDFPHFIKKSADGTRAFMKGDISSGIVNDCNAISKPLETVHDGAATAFGNLLPTRVLVGGDWATQYIKYGPKVIVAYVQGEPIPGTPEVNWQSVANDGYAGDALMLMAGNRPTDLTGVTKATPKAELDEKIPSTLRFSTYGPIKVAEYNKALDEFGGNAIMVQQGNIANTSKKFYTATSIDSFKITPEKCAPASEYYEWLTEQRTVMLSDASAMAFLSEKHPGKTAIVDGDILAFVGGPGMTGDGFSIIERYREHLLHKDKPKDASAATSPPTGTTSHLSGTSASQSTNTTAPKEGWVEFISRKLGELTDTIKGWFGYESTPTSQPNNTEFTTPATAPERQSFTEPTVPQGIPMPLKPLAVAK